MAGVSTKEIKNRIRSMESTRQITKAMEMVASSKLRKAQARAVASKPYLQTLQQTLQDIASGSQDFSSPYLEEYRSGPTLFLVIAGDRGLAGGYNANVLKCCAAQMEGQDALVLPMGKKALEYFLKQGTPLFSSQYVDASLVGVGDCFTISKDVCQAYLAGKVGKVVLVYTDFLSVLSQKPVFSQLLPLKKPQAGSKGDILYEPDPEAVFRAIVPEYLGGMLFGAVCQARSSELAARRNAMHSATENADEMIDSLSLQFNRARQAAITQEITEIVAGS